MKDYVELLQQLIRNRAVSHDAAAVGRSQECMRDWLAARGIANLVFEQCGDRKVLFASNRPGKVQEVILNVHLDVVPADEEQFTPTIQDGWLYGRGSSDDLGNAVAVAEALVRLKDAPVGIGVIFTADEEVGGETTAAMVKRGYAATTLGLVMDGGDCTLVAREKGILVFRLTAHGKACHSSRPWRGDNAIDKLLAGYGELMRQFRQWPQASEADVWHVTMAACQIEGGHAENQVPDTASMTINCRYTDPAKREEIIDFVKAASGLEVVVSRGCEPVFCDRESPLMRRLLATMQEVFPDRECRFEDMCGATDARHMVGWNVPVAITGVRGRNVHGRGECVELESIDRYIEWLVKAIGSL